MHDSSTDTHALRKIHYTIFALALATIHHMQQEWEKNYKNILQRHVLFTDPLTEHNWVWDIMDSFTASQWHTDILQTLSNKETNSTSYTTHIRHQTGLSIKKELKIVQCPVPDIPTSYKCSSKWKLTHFWIYRHKEANKYYIHNLNTRTTFQIILIETHTIVHQRNAILFKNYVHQ